MLDPRRTFATGCLSDGNHPRGSGFARRPRSWIRRWAGAGAASSDARPTQDLRDWMPQRWKLPPWVGLRPTPAFLDSLLGPSHRASSDARPTQDLREWMPSRWKPPPWVGLRPTPVFLDSLLGSSHRASSDARPTQDLRDWVPQRWKPPPWVGLRPTPAFLDSPLGWSRRRVERCSTHAGPSRLDASAMETTPVGRASPDARVPGFAAGPEPAPRRAMLDPRRTFATGCLSDGNHPRGSGFARRPCSWIRRWARAGAASSDARPTQDLRDWMPQRWKPPPWVGLRPTPAFLDSLLGSSHRASSDARPTGAMGPYTNGGTNEDPLPTRPSHPAPCGSPATRAPTLPASPDGSRRAAAARRSPRSRSSACRPPCPARPRPSRPAG